jgi:predicted enzyme related to lactoylglutathione lyase
MRLQPIVYTEDMDTAAAWYGAVLGVAPEYRSEAWIAFTIGDATLGIHAVERLPDSSRVAVSLIAPGALEGIIDRLAAAGIHPEGEIQEQPFGRSVLLRDPDGSPVQVNEHRSSSSIRRWKEADS